jgi:hypothetical protein
VRKFNGVKVFSATMRDDREKLGDKIAAWLAAGRERGIEPVEFVTTQSSDDAFHCIAITVFYNEPIARPR